MNRILKDAYQGLMAELLIPPFADSDTILRGYWEVRDGFHIFRPIHKINLLTLDRSKSYEVNGVPIRILQLNQYSIEFEAGQPLVKCDPDVLKQRS